MCTVTWIHGAEGYELFFNRDELSSRGPEEAPGVDTSRGVRFVAPRDGDAGGTWIAASERGLTLCLLNGYVASRGPAPAARVSRGAIVLSLVHAASGQELARTWSALDLAPFAPFSLVALAPGDRAALYEWDGLERRATLDVEDRMPIASSSADQSGARAFRRDLLAAMARERGGVTPELLDAFHREHAGAPSALTPCMHRADASTRSHCRVRVSASAIELAYAPGPPCRTPLEPPLRLARVPAPSRAVRR